VPGGHASRRDPPAGFHNLDVCTDLIDGKPGAVREYLRHFWSHWSGPGDEPASDDLDHLVSVCGPPGAFAASIAWYRAGAGSVAASLAERVPDPGERLAVPTTVLWPSRDPLFPAEWSDRISEPASSMSCWLPRLTSWPVPAPLRVLRDSMGVAP
jgi:hypothetical protein